jgi:methylmalonyl-CoA mutase C-terminal domain/subunit
MNEDFPVRILIGKLGLDGHDRGALVISDYLRNSGYEVIFSGVHKSASQVTNIALQEDVQAIGISILSGSHIHHLSALVAELKKSNSESILLFVGGIIPQSDFEELHKLGIKGIFPSGSSLESISLWLRENLLKNNG